MKRTSRTLVYLFLLVSSVASGEVLMRHTFSGDDALEGWHTSWKWGDARDVRKGTATLVERHGGSVRLSATGAPGGIHFWSELPTNLTFGDQLRVRFAIDNALQPNSHFTLVIGPGDAGHKAELPVSLSEAGDYSAYLPVWITRVFPSGTPFGIALSVWPGTSTVYIKEVSLVRPGE